MLHKMIKRNEISLIKLRVLLMLAFMFMVLGYFTVSENVTITRVIKVVLRVSMTIGVFLIYKYYSRNIQLNLSFENALAPLFYVAYLLLGLYSLLWSTKISYSLLQWVMVSESMIFSYYFIKIVFVINQFYEKKLRIHKLLAYPIFFVVLIFIIGMWVRPEEFFRLTHGGEVSRLGGYFMNPNELGMLIVIGLALFIMDLKTDGFKWTTILLIFVLIYALILTGSRSSLIGFLLILLFFVKKSSSKVLKIFALIALVFFVPIVFTKVVVKEGDMGEVLSMTGRIPFWTALLTEGLPQKPLLGNGFMRIADQDYFESVHTYAAKMTHNTFIQVLLNLGFIGFIICLFQLFFTLRAHLISKDENRKFLFVAIFIPILINSFTEFGIYGEANFGILFWQLLIFLYVFKQNPHLSSMQRVKLQIYQSFKAQ